MSTLMKYLVYGLVYFQIHLPHCVSQLSDSDQILERFNLKEEKGCFYLQFHRGQYMFKCVYCFWIYGEFYLFSILVQADFMNSIYKTNDLKEYAYHNNFFSIAQFFLFEHIWLIIYLTTIFYLHSGKRKKTLTQSEETTESIHVGEH